MKKALPKKKTKSISLSKRLPVYTPVVKKKVVHYTAEYIINPVHPVTVNVIGVGGTGSQVVNSLARMHSALKALGHPGLFVRAIDPDKVSEANMGRQLFSPSDVGNYKCMVLIGRINRFFGTDWEGVPELYDMDSRYSANITISCVDSGPARKEIKRRLLYATTPTKLKREERKTHVVYVQNKPRLEPYQVPYYWMDFGNMQDRGQVVLGTVMNIKQPTSLHQCVDKLPTIDKLHPDIFLKAKTDDQGPSCSLAEALNKQDLFINTNLANMGLGILWKMFRELHISYHGCYVNLNTMSVNPIKI